VYLCGSAEADFILHNKLSASFDNPFFLGVKNNITCDKSDGLKQVLFT
jgi:hypothetical protein